MRKLSEAEWISRFEQVQGRKPKPDELQLAYQSGLIGISKNYNYIYILLGALVAIVVGIGLTLVSSSMKNVKQTKSSATVASSIFSSTEKASATSSTSLAGNTKTSESSSASIDTPDANHAKEAYTENPRWTNDKASRLASLMVSWGNQMNQPGYKEITNEASSLPIRWMSDHNQTMDATYAAMVIAVLSIPLFRFTRDGKMYLFTVISSPLKKMGLPLCFIHQLPMVVSIMSKKQKMQTLNQDMQTL